MSQFFIKNPQLQKDLSQRIKKLYRENLQHQIEDINYHFFGNTLIIVMEGTLTGAERILNDNEYQMLAKQVREAIDKLIQPLIKDSIEEIMDVKVVDFLCDTTIDTSRTGAIAILGFESNSKDGSSRVTAYSR